MEGADEILALRDVDRGLAADRGIDHRQQRGRQLHAIDAAHPAGCGESGHVADHAAAERIDAGVAGCPHFRKRGDDAVEVVEGLGALAGRQDQHCELRVWARRPQCRDHRIAIQGGDMFVADHQGVASAQGVRQQGGVAQQAIPDMDGIGRGTADIDFSEGHAAASRCCNHIIRCSTTSSTPMLLVSTSRSASPR